VPKSTKVEPAVVASDLGVVCFCVPVDVGEDVVVDEPVDELGAGGRVVVVVVVGEVVVVVEVVVVGKVVVVVLVVVVVVGVEVVVLVDVVVV